MKSKRKWREPDMIDDWQLPHNEATERAVLGGLLLEPELLDEIDLRPEDFYVERHQLLFRLFLEIRSNGSLDILRLTARLEEQGKLEAVGGAAYLAMLDVGLPDLGMVPQYAATLRDRAVRRQLIQAAQGLITDALGGEQAPADFAGAAAQRIDGIVDRSRGAARGFVSALESAAELSAFLDNGYQASAGLKTGITKLDHLVDGMEAKTQWVVAGRPGQGKTAFMLQLAERAALDEGRRVGIVSLEMSREELTLRQLSRRTGIPFRRLRRASFLYGEAEQTERELRVMSKTHLWIDDTAGQTVQQVCSAVRTLKRKHGVDAIFIDYLTLLEDERKTGRGDRQDLALEAISKALAGLAKALAISVVTLVQLGKRSDSEKRKPTLSDLKDGGGEKEAYGALLLYRDPIPETPAVLSPKGCIIVGKNRGGECGEVETYFHGPTMTWMSSANGHPVADLPQEPEPPRQALLPSGEQREWFR